VNLLPILFLLNKGENMLQPIHDRILVKPQNPETKTLSGIVIPDNAQEKPSRGTVVKTGKGRVLENGTVVSLEVKENDVVLYGKHAGQQVKIGSDEYLVLKEEDILGVIEE
jgi:chaperonin GroES